MNDRPGQDSDVTSLLQQMEAGHRLAVEKLIPLVHKELRMLASSKMKNERGNHTLSVTALVNEAFLKLVSDPDQMNWKNRRHFFAAAAEGMRRILIDHARKRNAAKRGGSENRERVVLEQVEGFETGPEFDRDDILELDRALTALEAEDAESAEVVKLRFFAGLTYSQIAEQIEVSPRTAKNRWSYARAWLRRFMSA